MKQVLVLTFIVLCCIVKGQNSIDWDGNYQLQLSDFQSPATQVGNSNVYSLHTSASLDFSFQMSNAEFMFTKNFNSKVNCSFKRNAAALVAPDSATAIELLNFARYEFDLSELYARKLRKKLYEGKAVFSDVSFFRPLNDEIQNEFTKRHTLASQVSNLGKDSKKLRELHQEVLKEIEQLADFCKKCKPQKKKK